jgi:molybdopterin converting factor small subunit
MAITIEILFFASAREAAGVPSVSLDFDDSVVDTKLLRCVSYNEHDDIYLFFLTHLYTITQTNHHMHIAKTI